MAFDPTILTGKNPGGSTWWGFNVVLPNSKRDRTRYPTKREAEVHRLNLIKLFADGSGMSQAELLDAQSALYILKSAGITTALTTVASHYLKTVRRKVELTVSEYSTIYQLRKEAKGKAKKTLKEIKLYLAHFCTTYGSCKPSEVSWELIAQYLRDNSCREHRDKVLRNFFDWLAGKSEALAVLPDFPLDLSPFIHIDAPTKAVREKVEILYIEEVRKLIKAAIGTDLLAWVVWCVFTGSRPEAEARSMWCPKGPNHEPQAAKDKRLREAADATWRHIDLTRRTATIFSKKLRGKSRQLILQPNLVQWLHYFKSKGLAPRYSRKHFRALKDAIPAKDVQDILRHTAISNMVKLAGPSGAPMFNFQDVAIQCGTSVKMIEKHYLHQISDPKAVREFWSLKPENFGM